MTKIRKNSLKTYSLTYSFLTTTTKQKQQKQKQNYINSFLSVIFFASFFFCCQSIFLIPEECNFCRKRSCTIVSLCFVALVSTFPYICFILSVSPAVLHSFHLHFCYASDSSLKTFNWCCLQMSISSCLKVVVVLFLFLFCFFKIPVKLKSGVASANLLGASVEQSNVPSVNHARLISMHTNANVYMVVCCLQLSWVYLFF